VKLEESAEPLETQVTELRRRLRYLEAASSLPVAQGAPEEAVNRIGAQGGKTLPSTALVAIDTQIAQSSARDAYTWVQARGEIVLQDQFAADRAHLRRLEMIGLVGKIGLSALAVASGVGLAVEGFGLCFWRWTERSCVEI
jgi:hypothetical protein